MGLIRLDKFLADSKIGTRTEVKKYVKNGRIIINEAIVKDSSMKINTDIDKVYLDGDLISYEEYHYFMLNKPAGCVSATKDRISETVINILGEDAYDDLFPVGRLDKDTEGLLLITNDGKLAHELLSPKKHVDKTYLATITGLLSDEAKSEFEAGLDIGDDKKTLPAKIDFCEKNESGFIYKVCIHEGRFHQIKRMFEAVGEQVLYLKRVSMGPLRLDEKLLSGQYRRLTEEEIKMLKCRGVQ